MQVQNAHNNKFDNRMIGISVYIILPYKISELHTEPLRLE